MLLRSLLEIVIAQNRMLIRHGAVPRGSLDPRRSWLWLEGVRFRNEPWVKLGLDEFAPASLVRARGWGDCDDLIAARVAELRENGEEGAGVKIYRRDYKRRDGSLKRVMHAEARRENGSVEDMARWLGMGSGRE